MRRLSTAKTTVLALRITPTEKRAIEATAEEYGCSVSKLCRTALRAVVMAEHQHRIDTVMTLRKERL